MWRQRTRGPPTPRPNAAPEAAAPRSLQGAGTSVGSLSEGRRRAASCATNRRPGTISSRVSHSREVPATSNACFGVASARLVNRTAMTPSRTPMPPGRKSTRYPDTYDAAYTAMYCHGLPGDSPITPPTSHMNATPYIPHASRLPAIATRMMRAGGASNATRRPVMRAMTVLSRGTRNGSANSPSNARPTSTIATVRASGRIWSSQRQPIRRTIAIPHAMLMMVPSNAEPVETTADTPARVAIAAMAVICQILPGTYLPKLETLQTRAALQNVISAPQARIIKRQVWTRSAWVPSTSTPEATMSRQRTSASSGCARTASHWLVRTRPMRTRRIAAAISCATRKILRGGARNRRAIDVDVPARHRLRCERRQRMHSPRGAERLAAVRTRQQRLDRARERFDRAFTHENAGAIVLHDVRDPTGFEGDDRRFAQHRLHGDQAEPFID